MDELLLQRSGGKQTVKIGAEQLGDKVTTRSVDGLGITVCNLHVLQWGDEDIAQTDNLLCRQNRPTVYLLWYLVSIHFRASGA